MQIQPGMSYIACVNANGQRYWSRPMQGDRCSAANIKRTTVEEVGIFLASFVYDDLDRADSIEVYALPAPTLTIDPKTLTR